MKKQAEVSCVCDPTWMVLILNVDPVPVLQTVLVIFRLRLSVGLVSAIWIWMNLLAAVLFCWMWRRRCLMARLIFLQKSQVWTLKHFPSFFNNPTSETQNTFTNLKSLVRFIARIRRELIITLWMRSHKFAIKANWFFVSKKWYSDYTCTGRYPGGGGALAADCMARTIRAPPRAQIPP